MGYQGGHARSLWPRDNTTSDDLTLKTFTAILGVGYANLAFHSAHNIYVHKKHTLTRFQSCLKLRTQ